MSKKTARDVEKNCSPTEFANKLRRLAEAVEKGKRFEIQIAGERIRVPARAEFSIEHEREGKNEEIEFQVKWSDA
ncbi:MAG: amphi-Trp domain-containing protein [Nitrospirota bacterium]|nr:amphi-Trp domain-containing protein [Nitrospirota bacterium]